jgi:hypothetical protein
MEGYTFTSHRTFFSTLFSPLFAKQGTQAHGLALPAAMENRASEFPRTARKHHGTLLK